MSAIKVKITRLVHDEWTGTQKQKVQGEITSLPKIDGGLVTAQAVTTEGEQLNVWSKGGNSGWFSDVWN